MNFRHLLCTLFATTTLLHAAPPPTYPDIPYGTAERQKLDLWLPPPADGQPTALVLYFHGGGFTKGDKSKLREQKILPQLLDAGIAVAAVNYRYLSPAVPLPAVLRDSARALQFLRAHAADYGVDPTRVAAFGSSAGAGTSLWLAFHEDLADPTSADPIARQSTRLICAGSLSGQFTYNLPRWREALGDEANTRFGGSYSNPALYGLPADTDLDSTAAQAVFADLDFHAEISPDDPPVFIAASLPTLALTNVNEFLHHPRHSLLLVERCQAEGVPVVADIPAVGLAPHDGQPQTLFAFLRAQLQPPPQ